MKKIKAGIKARLPELEEMDVVSPETELTDAGRDTWVDILSEKDLAKEPITLSRSRAEEETAGIKAAILTEEGFEEVELTSPKQALENAGVHVDVISPHEGVIKAWDKTDWGKEVQVNVSLKNANPRDYDVLVLPGGVMNPDKLRQNKDAVGFVKEFIRSGKPIAAICHGPETLIETGMIDGVTMTSFPSIQTDLRNAGVNWVDQKIVHFGQFITSRKPSDLDAFNEELIHSLPHGL